eukprot:2865583-Rhodomonas_salina.1
MPHLQALAMTPYCRGRIGVVWIDNHPLDDPYGSAETSMVNQIRLVTQCKWIRQDPWHVMNRLLSKANNRCVCRKHYLAVELDRCSRCCVG